MNSKLEHLADLTFAKLKKYRKKKISLEERDFKRFIFSLFEEN